MLSSQTKDEITAQAMANLKAAEWPDKAAGFCIRNCAEADPEMIRSCIKSVGFFNNKTKYICNTAKILMQNFNSDIPSSIEGLCSLPGVGPKMAHLCMNSAHGIVSGIGVDVHVHRITNRLKWVHTQTPEETRIALESWLPKDKWTEINTLLVGFGQQTCNAVAPQCNGCLLSDASICPSAFKVGRSPRSSPVKIKKKTSILSSNEHSTSDSK
jgi:endonuclease-3